MASLDPVAYLRSTQPFLALPEPLFAEAAACLEVGFYPAGARLVTVGGKPLEHLYVIRKGAVRLEHDGQPFQVLEEGETFGYTSLITGQAAMDVVVDEDVLAYRLPGDEFRRLLADAQFAGHFAVGLSERFRSSLEHSAVAGFQPSLSRPVAALVKRPAVWIDPEATVADAARAMRRERISSVLIRTSPPSIVTDRDFRNRVLAEGLGPGTPVTAVASSPIRTLPAAARLHEAWTELLDSGVHHLPIERDGEVVGVLTSSDLLECTAGGPVALLRAVEQLGAREQLAGYAARVAEMVSALLAAGLDAAFVAGFVGRLNDALLLRLVRWAEADLGRAPVPWAWLALGAEGRLEQALLTDQDNALAYADEGAEHRPWFQAFAERIGADLLAAGFPPCPGGRMAHRWHQTVSEWVDEIDLTVAERPARAGAFYDLRSAAGALDLAPLRAALDRGARSRLLVRTLAREALAHVPPPTLLLRLRGASSVVDLKRQAILPVVLLARCYAMEAGSPARGTLERLAAARDAGFMDPELHAQISEAYRFLIGLRLRAQLRTTSERRPVTDQVTLADLSAVERGRLKDAFRAIREWQEKAAYHHQTDVL